jgi:hypothetical protein
MWKEMAWVLQGSGLQLIWFEGVYDSLCAFRVRFLAFQRRSLLALLLVHIVCLVRETRRMTEWSWHLTRPSDDVP